MTDRKKCFYTMNHLTSISSNWVNVSFSLQLPVRKKVHLSRFFSILQKIFLYSFCTELVMDHRSLKWKFKRPPILCYNHFCRFHYFHRRARYYLVETEDISPPRVLNPLQNFLPLVQRGPLCSPHLVIPTLFFSSSNSSLDENSPESLEPLKLSPDLEELAESIPVMTSMASSPLYRLFVSSGHRS